ncbi:prenyltransferase/squalene oxidase repeat-containing protein [Candidatus Neomarinimicrobiota bacterium]
MSRTGKGTGPIRPDRSKNRPRAKRELRQLPRSATVLNTLGKIVDLDPGWVQVLPINPIPRILGHGDAASKQALLSLIEPKNIEALKEERRSLNRFALYNRNVKRILDKQRRDGDWPVKATDEPKGVRRKLELLALIENLSALYQAGAKSSWPGVGDGIRALIAHQQPDGRFPLLYHHHAAIGSLLIGLGLVRNPAVHKAAHWIAERQRADGGWLHRQWGGDDERKPSCIWTTAEVLFFLSRYQTSAIMDQLAPASEFLLEHALQENHTTLLPEAHNWDILATGYEGTQLFHGGTLKVLHGASRSGFNPSDKRFKKLYSWLLGTQLDNGLFPRVNGKDEAGDNGVTVSVLELVRRVESSRPAETEESLASES